MKTQFLKANLNGLAREDRTQEKSARDAEKASSSSRLRVWRSLRNGFLLFGTIVACSVGLSAQERLAAEPIAASGLAEENLNRVAASADQVGDALRKDPGLMVELKRWVAKEATDQSQILDDSDLADEAILERLTRDLEFRSVATRLLQRYGYLVSKLNPDSDVGREHQALDTERTRQLSRVAEEAHTGAEANQKTESKRESGCQARECSEPAQPLDSQPTRDNPIEKPKLPARPAVQTIADYVSEGSPLSTPEKSRSLSLDPTTVSLEDSSLTQTSDVRFAEPPTKAPSVDRKRVAPAWPAGNEDKNENEIAGRTRLLARTNPYADIPSLYDMYVQASARPPVLERFGLDVFRNGTPDSGSYPMDLPVGPDYVVGPGDGLAIDLWGGVSEHLYRTVDREGRLSLPEVGPMLVSGRTMTEVQETVQRVLRTQFR